MAQLLRCVELVTVDPWLTLWLATSHKPPALIILDGEALQIPRLLPPGIPKCSHVQDELYNSKIRFLNKTRDDESSYTIGDYDFKMFSNKIRNEM